MVDESLMEDSALLEAMRAGITSDGPNAQVEKVLRIVRQHLGMDVGFVSEFVEGRRVFRHVDNGVSNSPVAVGGSDPLEDSYCARVVDGRLPQLMPDPMQVPEAAAMPVTRELPVGAHVSVPLHLPDGRLFGTFCCFSFSPDATLNQRDLRMLRAFAAIAADLIGAELEERATREAKRMRVAGVLASRRMEVRYQPIFRLDGDTLAGFEALARFPDMPSRTPDVWFNEAAEAGLAADLEFLAVELACEHLPRLPDDMPLSVNLSPEAILSPQFAALFARLPLHRVVLEVTEHAAVRNYAELVAAIRPFRARGLRLAVDDAGAGHSSFRHVLDLKPDIIKLDMSLTRDVDRDPARCALATALTTFGHAIGSEIVAEGVETEAELAALRAIGVTKVQGYLTGRPMPVADALALAGGPATGWRRDAAAA